jgi:cytoskeletal protein CcmA (bactofilin family)
MRALRLAIFAVSSLVASLPLSAAPARAGYGRTGVTLHVGDDVYAAGGTVAVTDSVVGDLAAAGGNVVVSGPVGADALVTGGSVRLAADVGDDARIAGGSVDVIRRVGGHLVAAGGIVHAHEGSVIASDVLATGGTVILEGTIDGGLVVSGGEVTLNGTLRRDARIIAGTLRVGPNAVIQGALRYSSRNPAQIDPGAKIAGPVSREARAAGGREAPRLPVVGRFLTFSFWIGLVSILVAGIAIVRLFPALAGAVAHGALGHFWKHSLIGLVALIALPIMSVALMLTLIGFPIGAMSALLVLAALLLAKICAAIVAGSIVGRWLDRGVEGPVTWRRVVVGALVVAIAEAIPFAGAVVSWLVLLSAFGGVLYLMYRGALRARVGAA